MVAGAKIFVRMPWSRRPGTPRTYSEQLMCQVEASTRAGQPHCSRSAADPAVPRISAGSHPFDGARLSGGDLVRSS